MIISKALLYSNASQPLQLSNLYFWPILRGDYHVFKMASLPTSNIAKHFFAALYVSQSVHGFLMNCVWVWFRSSKWRLMALFSLFIEDNMHVAILCLRSLASIVQMECIWCASLLFRHVSSKCICKSGVKTDDLKKHSKPTIQIIMSFNYQIKCTFS